MFARTLVTVLIAGGICSPASAGVVGVSNIGGGIVLNSGPVGDSLFGNEQSTWSSSSLIGVHTALAAQGIATNGKITFLASDTSQGLSFLALVDQSQIEGAAILGHVHMDSVASGNNLAYVKDTAGNLIVSGNAANARIASGDFTWNSNGGGDGFAWADLVNGNTMTFRFNRNAGMDLNLDDPSTFQFLNWNGSAWEVVTVPDGLLSFSTSGDFGFAATVTPSPSGAMLAGVVGLTGLRRRRA